jgi:two-component system, LytTR family, response regulator
MLSCIIIDDELNARISLRGILQDHFKEVKILAECENIPAAVKAIHKHNPTIIFLDIEMPNQNGFALFDYFEEEELSFKIVFVTAYAEYSLQAFEMSAIDYLLKPVKREALAKALKKLEASPQQKQQLLVLKENLSEGSDKTIILQTAENIFVVALNDLIFIQAEGNYTKFHTSSHDVLTITKKISEFEYLEKLDIFFRSHRSFLINLSKIKKVDKRDFLITMSNNEIAYLAQDKKHILLEKISLL